MIDKNFCMSSYLAFRYIEKEGMEFAEGLQHRTNVQINSAKIAKVRNAEETGAEIQRVFGSLKGERLGLLLSGGMDSAILASYMRGCDAYTFRFLGGEFQKDELQRAERFAAYNGMTLHYVDINWEAMVEALPYVMASKGAPVHSIEPQLYIAAKQAQADGITRIIIGDGADYVFGGMDKLLSRDWNYSDWKNRFSYLDPALVLKEPVDMDYLFRRYSDVENQIHWLKMMDDIATEESYGSYDNAFAAAGMPYTDPYDHLQLAEPLDLNRIRNGESKYVIRALFRMRYPDLPLPEKNPMPRPVDAYFKDWQGPTRPEFRRDIDMSAMTGNQKWQLWCLEQFLIKYVPLKIGYTTGVYDLFHIGHLNLLRKAKAQCDYLIVGVSTDDLVEYKGKRSVIPFEERKEIVGAIKYVDEVVTQENMDKLGAWKKYHFDVMFVGDDWKGTDKWNKIEADLAEVGAKVVYFPYTKGTSSTLINETLKKLRNE